MAKWVEHKKYRDTEQVWILEGKRVRSFNAEEPNPYMGDKRDISWSHGFTHFVDLDSGKVRYCGTNWFEKNVRKEKKK